jgi:uncharacterized protein with HEPN domain
MPDFALAGEILEQMLEAVSRIERRSSGIGTANDFMSSDEGLDRLDAICMMLIALGESCKHLDRITEGRLLPRYPSIDWKGVKGIRDVLSHQYFDLDAEAVFGVCKKHIPELKRVMTAMLHDIRG